MVAYVLDPVGTPGYEANINNLHKAKSVSIRANPWPNKCAAGTLR